MVTSISITIRITISQLIERSVNMDLNTAIAILAQQSNQLVNLISQLNNMSYQAQELINQENPIPTINPQIHSLTASMSIVMTSVNAQDVLVQQAIDKVAELSATV